MSRRPTYRVVIHVDESEPTKHRAVLGNVANLLTDLGPDATEVEVVAHGPGLDLLLTGTPHGEQVGALQEQGVRMLACANTLRIRDLTAADLLAGVEVVSAGIGHIVRREHEGWQYVRP